jgi:hypothetical protein
MAMGGSDTSHPYRPEPPAAGAAQPRHVPWIVGINVLFGDFAVGGALTMIIAFSACTWIVSDAIAKVFLAAMTVGLATMFWRHVATRNVSLRLLRCGRVIYGRLVDKRVIPASGDDGEMHHLFFSFEYRGQTYTIEARTADPAPLTDNPREQIVFLPSTPQRGQLVDSLPCRPRIRDDNTIDARPHIASALLSLVLLAGVAAVQVGGAYLWLR